MTPQMLQKQQFIDNYLSRTWYTIKTEVVDQVLKITPFYSKMLEGGRLKTKLPEGSHWEYTIRYAKEDSNLKWFGRGDVFGLGSKENLTRLKFEAKNLGTSVVRYWEEEQAIRGKAQLVPYGEDITASAKESLHDALATALWTNPTSNSKQINSLTELIAVDPTTGVFGGLDRSVNPHLWNLTVDFTGKTIAADLLKVMRSVYNTCSSFRTGTQKAPDLIITTQAIYEEYEGLCEDLRQIQSNSTDRASLGFGELRFKNCEMFWDPECPAGHMYFLNTSTLEIPVDPAVYFDMTEWKHIAGNSLDMTAQILSRLQLCCNMPAKNAVIHGIPEPSI